VFLVSGSSLVTVVAQSLTLWLTAFKRVVDERSLVVVGKYLLVVISEDACVTANVFAVVSSSEITAKRVVVTSKEVVTSDGFVVVLSGTLGVETSPVCCRVTVSKDKVVSVSATVLWDDVSDP